MTAAGVGLTLTATSNIIFAEMHFTPAVMLQAEDRAHRIGQQYNVHCHYLISNDTLDDRLYSMLENKMQVVSSIVDGENKKLNAIPVNAGTYEQKTNETKTLTKNKTLD